MAAAFTADEQPVRAAFRRHGTNADSYRLWIDGPVLHIAAWGVWDIATTQACVRDVTRIVAELRRDRAHLRVLVDRSAMPVFGPADRELLMATYASILRAGDRVALVVESCLAKAQVRQIAGREETQMFLSVSAARTWLLAYD